MTPKFTKRVEEYLALRDKGMTYDEIAKLYGISRQAVCQTIRRFTNGPKLAPSSIATINDIKYVGLANWMMTNNVSLGELERRCGGIRFHHSLIQHHEPGKRLIDIILAVTGLTYEECFKEREKE